MKYYNIYGYDSNFDMGGSHECPLLCTVRATDESQALSYAETLPRYQSGWCGKGYIKEVKVIDLTEVQE
jgi:hypothetical protein